MIIKLFIILKYSRISFYARRFLPRMAQSALNQTLEECQIILKEESHHLDEYQHSVTCKSISVFIYLKCDNSNQYHKKKIMKNHLNNS